MKDGFVKCKSCGIEMIDHLGIEGTCKKLVDRTAELAEALIELDIAVEALELLDENRYNENMCHIEEHRWRRGIAQEALKKIRGRNEHRKT